jgi:hypothetical protein
MSQSNLLTRIIEKQNRIANVCVVFVDIEKYSKRRTVNQIAVVDAFTSQLKTALLEISREYIDYAQANNVNFDTDIIKLPTGDGAEVIFPFEGLHDIHLRFARILLRHTDKNNRDSFCEKFVTQGWCNCHQNYNLAIGVSEGKAIIYTDINGGVNVAGAVVNMAARAMNQADRNQIMLTHEAYNQLIEMDDDPTLADSFQQYEAEIKHGLKMQIYQYCDPRDTHVNSSPPRDLALARRSEQLVQALKRLGMPIPDASHLQSLDKEKMMDGMEAFVNLLSDGTGASSLPPSSSDETNKH